MSVYFLLNIFAMFAGTILLRHDPEAAVPLQSIGWNMAFCLADNSYMVKPKRSLTLGDGLYTQYHPIPNYDVFFFCCHIELYAFHCFCVCANVCPIDTFPCVFLLYFHFLILYPLDSPPLWFLYTLPFASPPLHILLSSSPPHLQRRKRRKGGEEA